MYFKNMRHPYKSYDYNFKKINFKLKKKKAQKYIILNTLGVDSPIHIKIKVFYYMHKKYKIQHTLIILLKVHQYI
jgi:hypothetical protein